MSGEHLRSKYREEEHKWRARRSRHDIKWLRKRWVRSRDCLLLSSFCQPLLLVFFTSRNCSESQGCWSNTFLSAADFKSESFICKVFSVFLSLCIFTSVPDCFYLFLCLCIVACLFQSDRSIRVLSLKLFWLWEQGHNWLCRVTL